MDQDYMDKMGEAFLEELAEIEKNAGIVGGVLRGLSGGFKTLGRLAGVGGPKASLKGLWRSGRMAYRRGARGTSGLAGASGPLLPGTTRGGGVAGGLKNLAQSRAGQAAGATALTGLGLYGGGKLLFGGGRQQ